MNISAHTNRRIRWW